MAAQGEIGAETLLWKSGMADWVACRSFPDLASLSQGAHANLTAPFSPQTHWGYGFAADPQFLPAQAAWPWPAWYWESSGCVELQSAGNHLRSCRTGPDRTVERKADRQGNGDRWIGPGHHRTGVARFPFFHGMVGGAIERMQNR